MEYNTRAGTESGAGYGAAGTWPAYWIAVVRVLTGWWFFHAGFTKLLEGGLTFDPSGYLQGMAGTVLAPVGTTLAGYPGIIGPMVVIFETLIGLALIVGLLTRFASFGGVMFMTMFWIGNAEYAHGVVNSDFMGLLLFTTIIVFGAGRYYGLDSIVERTGLVQGAPRLKYLLG
ncbi:DoxX family protein [Halobacterium salinarum]|uniref:DoxX domain protein n=1 Tax=Halobacterium salinarum (strain ATCC 33171 / DSM 3754 / JCM 8978 / NBRC 102687 / NCIMB 764 / 91-R6) TaxID=2597657 RepID=A0A4D6GQ27_HALS9|nr:DoxX family protein [Halobacterium salinarum]MDL0122751.1 DoxX family protein [Halobacterium salinarum]MDL0124271.1 DoxX family protein [Halobacterium salinarum]MDL0132906.1 DoxX family protein [Halobacterium salinarum]MDL0136753.1 DoxX family protein [Halobacterium salinarum]QCC43753.1 DoxX domain protein [Halobacterium salinarum]